MGQATASIWDQTKSLRRLMVRFYDKDFTAATARRDEYQRFLKGRDAAARLAADIGTVANVKVCGDVLDYCIEENTLTVDLDCDGCDTPEHAEQGALLGYLFIAGLSMLAGFALAKLF